MTLLKKYVIILKKAFFSKSEKKCVELPQNGATAQYSSAEGYSSEGISAKRSGAYGPIDKEVAARRLSASLTGTWRRISLG